MQIFNDSRSIAHFGEKEGEIYTLIFPTSHTLKQRLDALQFIAGEVLLGIKIEEKKAEEEAAKKAEEEAKATEEIKENSVVEENVQKESE
jgi:hypothetical protein